jgi:hypothetical protein
MWTYTCGIDFELTRAQAELCSQGGRDAEPFVLEVMKSPRVRRQLKRVDPAHLRAELESYGAWEAHELADHAENLKRLVWLAACDITEEVVS